MQRLAGEKAGIVLGERPAKLKGLLQILGEVLGVALGHAVEVALALRVGVTRHRRLPSLSSSGKLWKSAAVLKIAADVGVGDAGDF